MTKDEHRARHQLLHQMFDELFADFAAHSRGTQFLNRPIQELMEWSYRQTLEPEDLTVTPHTEAAGSRAD